MGLGTTNGSSNGPGFVGRGSSVLGLGVGVGAGSGLSGRGVTRGFLTGSTRFGTLGVLVGVGAGRVGVSTAALGPVILGGAEGITGGGSTAANISRWCFSRVCVLNWVAGAACAFTGVAQPNGVN